MIPIAKTQIRSSIAYTSIVQERAVTIDESYTRPRNRTNHDHSLSNKDLEHFFEDPDFGPDRRSLTFSGHPDFEKYLNKIVWKRPFEINPNAKMIKEGMSRSDIRQQALGDCWFVAACSALADNRNLLSRVVTCHSSPLSGPRYSGSALKFHFHQNGEWIEVIIDDYLPVREYGSGRYQLIFSKSTDDEEMWVSLFEKAYAKLKGCYESLVGGNATCALSDLTGGITESLILEDEDASSVWKSIRDVTTNNRSFATASCGRLLADGGHTPISEDEVGLLESHAYSVVNCVSFSWKGEKVKLVRLRNPWASFEYKAKWSDRDPIWRDSHFGPIATKLGFKAKSDGEFFMEFSHFLSLFRGVSICTVEPNFSREGEDGAVGGRSFQESVKGEWVDGVNAGGCMNFRDSSFPINPQFYLQSRKCHEENEETFHPASYSCLISLLQFHPPSPTHKIQLEHIGLYVYELKKPKESRRKLPLKHFQYNPIYARNKIFTNFQETVVRMEMRRDRSYVIIPCTFQPGKNSQFLLRVYSNTPISLTELK